MKNNCTIDFLAIALIFLVNVSVYAQTEINLPESLGRCLGIYKTESKKVHKDLKDFEYFQLKKFPNQDTNSPVKDTRNKVYITGKLEINDGKSFEFKKAFVKVVKIGDDEYYKGVEFTTAKVEGINYKFVGEFIENVTQEKEGDPYIKIKGKLTKYKNGNEVFNADIPFYEFAEL